MVRGRRAAGPGRGRGGAARRGTAEDGGRAVGGARGRRLRGELARELRQRQARRVQDESSKTRLSILYFALLGNLLMVVTQAISLLRIFNESFGGLSSDSDVFSSADND